MKLLLVSITPELLVSMMVEGNVSNAVRVKRGIPAHATLSDIRVTREKTGQMVTMYFEVQGTGVELVPVEWEQVDGARGAS